MESGTESGYFCSSVCGPDQESRFLSIHHVDFFLLAEFLQRAVEQSLGALVGKVLHKECRVSHAKADLVLSCVFRRSVGLSSLLSPVGF